MEGLSEDPDLATTLSVNDHRVILISQFLVETCAGSSAGQLPGTLSKNLTDWIWQALRQGLKLR
jgi:hypothetical protein